MDRPGVCFNEWKGGGESEKRWTPRSIFIDMDRQSLDMVANSQVGRLVRPDNYVGGKQGSANVWAKAHLIENHYIME